MKKSANLLLVFLGLVIFSCSLFSPKTGDREGFEIYFSTNPDNIKSITSTRDVSLVQPRETYYPKNGALGFARFWFPTSETYNVLKTKGTLENGIIPLKAEDLSGLVFYKAIEKSNEKPLVLDAASGEPYKPEIDLPYGALYKGLVIEYVFLQIEMDDYKLRYYHQDSGKYKAGDILIDLNNDNKDWQYIYNKRVLTFDFKNPQDKSEHHDPKATATDAFLRTQSLSAREQEVVRCIIAGMSDKEIAVNLGISSRTVANHNRTIYRKTGVGTRFELISKVLTYTAGTVDFSGGQDTLG